MNKVIKKYFYYKSSCIKKEAEEEFSFRALGEITENICTFVLPNENETYTFAMRYEYDSWNRMKSYTDGSAIQHLHYLPFGEEQIDQRLTSFNSRYTFSAKEKDVDGYRYSSADEKFWNDLNAKHPNASAGIRFGGKYDLYYKKGQKTDKYNNPAYKFKQ